MFRKAVPAAVLAISTVILGLWFQPLVGAEAEGDPSMLLAKAETAFKINNYNETIQLCQSLLRAAPSSPEAAKAERLIGLSQYGLRDFRQALSTLADLVKRRPEMDKDADVVEALALSGVHWYAAPGRQVVDWLNKAIALREAEDDKKKQLALLFQLAAFYEGMDYLRQEEQMDWRDRQLDAVARTLDTYDRVLKVGGTIDDQLRALRGKVRILLNNGHALVSYPREKWPAGFTTPYDLARPFPLAIEVCEEIIRRWPERPSAAESLESVGDIQANYLQDFIAAVATYEDVQKRYARSKSAAQSKQKIAAIKAPQLAVMIPDITVPGEKVKYHWQARNIRTVDVKAYPVDLFVVLRKIEEWNALDKFPATGNPAAEWTIATGDKGDYQAVHSGEEPALAPLKESNAYLIVARGSNPDGKKVEARAMALVSRLGVVAKTGKSKSVWFAMDSLTGEPVVNTDLLVQRFVRRVEVPVLKTWKNVYSYDEQKVPDSGLAELAFPRSTGREWNHQMIAIARNGNDYAVSDARYWGYWWGYGEGFQIYSLTDRPVYRPGQAVSFKHLVRKYEKGVFVNVPKFKVRVRVNDARGAVIYEKEHVTNENGAVSGDFQLVDEAALGMYSIALLDGDNNGLPVGPGANFRVEEYKKPEFQVTVEADKPIYKIGDVLKVKIHGEYYFGGPVANAAVHYTVHRQSFHHFVPWRNRFDWFYDEEMGGRFWWGPRREDLILQGDLTTDAEGNVFVEVKTEPFPNAPNEDLQFKIDVRMVDESRREIVSRQTVKVTRQAFFVSLEPRKHLYQPGDTVRVGVKSQNANNQPVEFQGTFTVSFVEQREEKDSSGKVKIEERLQQLSANPIDVGATGEADVEFVSDRQGLYKVVVETPDPFTVGANITGSTYVWVAKGTGEFAHYANRDIELVLEQDTYTSGETIRMLVNCRHKGAYVLLTVEGDDVYGSRVVYVEGTQTTVDWPVEKAFQPNVMIRAATFRDNQIFQEERALKVPPIEQFLAVKIIAGKEQYRPREEAEIAVEVTDWQGKPAANVEFSLGVFDASILYIQPETRGDIRKFYYGNQRPVTVQTTSSYAFRAWTQGREVMNEMLEADGAPRRGGRFAAAGGAMPAPMIAKAEAAPLMDEAGAAPEDRDKAPGGEFASTEVRTDFRDTVFWAAHLVTDSNGKATVKFRFPDSLTLWQLTSIAADPNTRVGEVTHEVRTKKNILIRLQTPRFLVEGDRVILSAIAHNYLETPKRVRVDMTEFEGLRLLAVDSSQWAELARPIALDAGAAVKDVEIPAGGEARVDFVFLAPAFGNAKVTAKALTDEESDAMRLEIPIYEYGAEKLLAQSGILFGAESSRSASATLKVPEQIRKNSQTLTVTMSPTIAGVMLESLPYLLDYPYGCTEQTMSRFLPAVLTANTLRKLGMDLESIAKIESSDKVVRERLAGFRKNPVFHTAEMNKIIKAGVARLADFQHADGGWGWWKEGESNPYISAYVVSGLALAKESGVELPTGMLERGLEVLVGWASRPEPIREYPWQRGENTSTRAYILYAIGRADAKRLRDPEVLKSLRKVYEGRDDLNDYSRALTAIALADANLVEEGEIVLANIKDRARIDDETNTASWGDARGYYYWYQCGTEATSFSLKALIRIEPNSPLIPKIVNWLVRNRQGTRWFNTKDTATACYALADYLNLSGELDPDLTITADLDGKELRRVRVTKENLFTFDSRLVVSGDELGMGAKNVTIRAEGRGNVYWGVYATFYTKEDKIEAAGNEIFVTRQYQKLIPKEVAKTRKVFDPQTNTHVDEAYMAIEHDRVVLKEGDKLASGDLIEVVLSIDARNNFEYLLFEDPKPAGCEPTELRSGYSWGGGFGAYTELRDEKVAFFASYLNQGKHTITYQLRAEIPGEFHALPAHGECMYTPFVQANGESWVFRIADR